MPVLNEETEKGESPPAALEICVRLARTKAPFALDSDDPAPLSGGDAANTAWGGVHDSALANADCQ